MAVGIGEALQRVADRIHTQYNCSVATAFHSEHASVAAAAGFTDAGLGLGIPSRRARADDMYVWGSTTKIWTGPAVLQLVERGLVRLEDPIGMHIDPIFVKLTERRSANGTGTSMRDHFGAWIDNVTIHDLLHMTSGVADYDRGPYTRDQFANREREFSPVEIILDYVGRNQTFAPGSGYQSYCSTNYILLGFVAATHYHKDGDTWSWEAYDQLTVIPAALRKAFKHSAFANSGPCSNYTPVHGFLQSYSEASIPSQDISNVSCLGGWTGGNYVGSVGDVAHYTYDLFSTVNPRIVSAATQPMMSNWSVAGSRYNNSFYGVNTFNLDWAIGNGDVKAYGHVGDTYGYQSQTTYFPGYDFVFTVATNVETNSQAQPADATCQAYHELVSVLTADEKSPPVCKFHVPRHFIGTCSCKW